MDSADLQSDSYNSFTEQLEFLRKVRKCLAGELRETQFSKSESYRKLRSLRGSNFQKKVRSPAFLSIRCFKGTKTDAMCYRTVSGCLFERSRILSEMPVAPRAEDRQRKASGSIRRLAVA
jgi:hypothetical protein